MNRSWFCRYFWAPPSGRKRVVVGMPRGPGAVCQSMVSVEKLGAIHTSYFRLSALQSTSLAAHTASFTSVLRTFRLIFWVAGHLHRTVRDVSSYAYLVPYESRFRILQHCENLDQISIFGSAPTRR